MTHDIQANERIREHMREYVAHLPDYTCVETIVRAQRADESTAYRPMDTLRVEVLHIGDKELYAWPGEKKFEDKLGLLVGVGTTSSGEFALHARTRHGMAGAYTNQHKRCITFQQRRRGKDSQLGLPFAYGGAIAVLADLRHTNQGTVAPRRPVA